MIEVTGNLWTYPADIRLITTNGTINSRGLAVMGRGCALEAAERFPDLREELAVAIHGHGNRPLRFDHYNLITFPVKHNWWEVANIQLIQTSARLLKDMLDPSLTYVAPRFGAGNGKLSWEAVREALRPIALPDNVHIITFPAGAHE